jgi:hypothetical protein
MIWSSPSFGQQLSREKRCNTDTLIAHIDRRHHLGRDVNDTATTYKAFDCTKISRFGLRLDIGFASYSYNDKTKRWLGNHPGPSFNFILVYEKFNLGFRFKPWTVNPGTQMIFGNDTLTRRADLNPVKLDYYMGYSIDMKNNFSIEPYLGLTRNMFIVINEDELNKTFHIRTATGLIAGVTFNKYFKLKEFKFISAFAGAGYASTDFTKTNNKLDKGYFEWTIGVSCKGFFKKHFLERINPVR